VKALASCPRTVCAVLAALWHCPDGLRSFVTITPMSTWNWN
jgi:hypothetical protein